jgi:peroxiredoxin
MSKDKILGEVEAVELTDYPSEIPNVLLQFREGDEEPEDGGCPIGGDWKEVLSADLFADKRVIVVGLPGAFTPTCSSNQLPGFDSMFEEFQDNGIDEIFCVSVNDAFVMNAWKEKLGLKNINMIPDGNAVFTTFMNMSVYKSNVGFGIRSWRYAMIVNDGNIEKMFVEEGKDDNISDDPYEVSTPENVLEYLKS